MLVNDKIPVSHFKNRTEAFSSTPAHSQLRSVNEPLPIVNQKMTILTN